MRLCATVGLVWLIALTCHAADSGIVRGVVVSDPAGVRLMNWTVALFGVSAPRYRRTVASGSDGRFSFESVPPGTYRVMDDQLSMAYLRHLETPDPPPLGQAIELSSGQTISDITLKIEAGSIIEGKVIGPDERPLGGLQVLALKVATVDPLRRMFQAGAGGITIADGRYQITGLSPGAYSVIADQNWELSPAGTPAQTGWLRTAYPSSVTLGSSEVANGIDIQMQRGVLHSIHGVVAAPNTRLMQVFLQKGTDVTTLRMISVGRNGTFTINQVAPGRYNVDLIGPGRPAILEHVEVDVTDQDISDLRLEPKPSPKVTARVIAPAGVDTTEVNLFLRPAANPTAPLVFSRRSADGVYTFEDASPAPNVLSALGLPPGMVIRSIKLNGRPATNLTVDLSAASGQIEIVIGPAISDEQQPP